MPITQSRMLSLLSAAQDYKQALELVCHTLAAQEASLREGTTTPAQALQLCFASANAVVLLSNPTISPAVIGVESAHFKSNQRRNIKKAEKARAKRRLTGLPIASTAPVRVDKNFNTTPSLLQQLSSPDSVSAAADFDRRRAEELTPLTSDQSTQQAQAKIVSLDSALDQTTETEFISNLSQSEQAQIRAEQQIMSKIREIEQMPQWKGEKKGGS